MRVQHTVHSRERMRQRGVSQADLDAALVNPITTFVDSRRHSKTFIGQPCGESGRSVKAVVGWPPEVDDTVTLITVMWKEKGS